MDTTTLDRGDPSPPLLRVLILEDNPRDAKLTASVLEGGGYTVQVEVTDSPEVFRESLEKTEYDVILADFNLRNWTALDALEILKRSGKHVPLIVVTGAIGDEAAVECIKRGAADYVLKDRPARLPLEVRRALEEKRLREERKRAEEALIEERHLLRTLMDNLPDVIYFKDRESRFTRINKAHAKGFGLSDPAQAIGKTDFDFFAEEHARQAFADEQEIIRTGQPILAKEEKEAWPDGRETWVSTTKMPLRDANGNILGTFGVSRDVTERKSMEGQLRQTAKIEAIGRLAGGVAHYFNNLLTIISGYGQLLQERLSPEALGPVEEILKASDRAATLTRQLLAFSRRQILAPQVLDLNSVVANMEKMLGRLIGEDIDLSRSTAS